MEKESGHIEKAIATMSDELDMNGVGAQRDMLDTTLDNKTKALNWDLRLKHRAGENHRDGVHGGRAQHELCH